MFSLSSIILAFFAGILGTLIGGTQTFICTGFVGLLVIIFNHCGIDTTFPATHHTTLVAGYAIAQAGNILIAIAFGVIAHFVGLLFGMVFNTDCGTHVDPPAVAIAICSLILFTLF